MISWPAPTCRPASAELQSAVIHRLRQLLVDLLLQIPWQPQFPAGGGGGMCSLSKPPTGSPGLQLMQLL